MKRDDPLSSLEQRYKAAHHAHYSSRDLRRALDLYRSIVGDHPDSSEAGYSRSQIENIVRQVVPEKELFDAQVESAMAHVARSKSSSAATDDSEARS